MSRLVFDTGEPTRQNDDCHRCPERREGVIANLITRGAPAPDTATITDRGPRFSLIAERDSR